MATQENFYWLIGIFTVILLIAGISLIVYVAIAKKKQEIHFLEKQQTQEAFNQTLLQTQIEIQDQTLQAISQEIHDNIGQVLSLAKLNVSQVEVADDFNNKKLSNAQNLLTKAIQDLRDVSKSLSSDAIAHIGFKQALQNEVDIVSKSGCQFELSTIGQEIKLQPQTQLILFRMIQECINNIVKHSQSTQNFIQLIYKENTLEINITDHGIGFNINDYKAGQGIANINKRAKLISAQVSMESHLQKGTSTKILIENIE